MDRFSELPREIQSRILGYAATPTPTNIPRLAIVTLNLTEIYANLQRIVENSGHLLASDPLYGLLQATFITREAALGTLVRVQPAADPTWPLDHSGLALAQPDPDPTWALEILNLGRYHLRPHLDIIFLRTIEPPEMPWNYSTAIGLINGRTLPNIMLEAATFAMGDLGIHLRFNPLLHSWHSLRQRPGEVFNALHVAGPEHLADPDDMRVEFPQNLYFFLGTGLPSCTDPSHPGSCIHYDHLEIVPDDRLGEWGLREDQEDEDDVDPVQAAQVAHVHDFWRQWQRHVANGHIERLPSLFFARVRGDRAPTTPGAGGRRVEGANLFGNMDPFGELGSNVFNSGELDPVGETQQGRDMDDNRLYGDESVDPLDLVNLANSSEVIETQDMNNVSASGNVDPRSVDPAAGSQLGSDPQHNENPKPEQQQSFEDWFDRVYVPEAMDQYVEKWKASSLQEPWYGRVFHGVDTLTPGPSGQDHEAFRQWLTTTLRPIVEQELQRM